jgi:hypothetical protein
LRLVLQLVARLEKLQVMLSQDSYFLLYLSYFD